MNEDQHAEEIKKSFEKMIGVDLSLKRKRKNDEDLKREIFEKLIFNLEKLNVRSNLLTQDFQLELGKYDEPFYEVIDNLLYMTFGKDASEVIFFYLYERTNPDGSVNEFELRDKDGNLVSLNNSTDLWNIVNYINSKK